MTTRTDASTTPTDETILWHLPDWDGPKVEIRPDDADPAEWPKGAVERVTFTPEDFPDYPDRSELPATAYFGADGWPLTAPESVKPKLDPRCRAELYRYPWSVSYLPGDRYAEITWLREFRSLENFRRFNRQAEVLTGEHRRTYRRARIQ